jgi:hypothetical protein
MNSADRICPRRRDEPALSLPGDETFAENGSMRFRVIFILLLGLIPISSFARVHRSVERAIDPAYGSALAAANKFLHAWQTQDHETGIMMLTDAARQHASPEQLQEFFSSGAQAAFEIQRGRRRSAAEYVFPAVLFDGETSRHPHVCRIVIVKAGKEDWAVDRLP